MQVLALILCWLQDTKTGWKPCGQPSEQEAKRQLNRRVVWIGEMGILVSTTAEESSWQSALQYWKRSSWRLLGAVSHTYSAFALRKEQSSSIYCSPCTWNSFPAKRDSSASAHFRPFIVNERCTHCKSSPEAGFILSIFTHKLVALSIAVSTCNLENMPTCISSTTY